MSDRFSPVIDHPLIAANLERIGSRDCKPHDARRLLREIGLYLGYEAVSKLTDSDRKQEIAIVPVLRAGLVMAEGLQDIIPSASIGHIGIYRQKNSEEVIEYLITLPIGEKRIFFLVDPMVGTGKTACHAIDILHKHLNISNADIRFICLLIAKSGYDEIKIRHPGVRIYAAAEEEQIGERFSNIDRRFGDYLFNTVGENPH